MSKAPKNSVNSRKDDNSGGSNKTVTDNENVPPEDRREKVLAFLGEHDIALPPLAIYAGLKRQEGITFSYRTVQNALSDLIEEGYVQKVDTDKLRDKGQIVPVGDSSGRRSYYFITEEGRKRVCS